MNKKIIILFLITLIISVNFSQMCVAIINESKINADSPDQNYDTYTVKMYFSKPELTSNDNFISVDINECNSYIIKPGKPMMPLYNKIISFAKGTKIIDINFTFSNEKQITLNKKISPSPSSIVSDSTTEGLEKKFINETFYQNSNFYPDSWIKYSKRFLIEDGTEKTLLSIHVNPLQYSPAKNILKYIENAEITVSYIEPNQKKCLTDIESEKYDLLVITPEKFSDELNSLKEHKNNHNIRTKIVNLSEIYDSTFFDVKGRDKPEKIKYFLKNAYENWSIEYVLLVGGEKELPVRYFLYAESSTQEYFPSIITDLYYADIYDETGKFCSWDSNNNNIFAEYNIEGRFDKMDLYPDLSVGRFPCTTKKEVKNVVNKVINYENSDIRNESWFKRSVICAGDSAPSYSQFKNIFTFYNVSSIKEFYSYMKENASELAVWEGEYIGDILANEDKTFKAKKLYASRLFPGINKKRLSPLTINHAINQGAGFVFFLGHGAPTSWKTNPPFGLSLLSILLSSYLPMDEDLIYLFKTTVLLGFLKNVYFNMFVKLLRNDNKLPVYINEGCSCGDFNRSDSPLLWEFVKKKNGGAIASFGCTGTSAIYQGKATKEGLNGYMVHELYKSYLNGEKHAGKMLKKVKCKYLNEHSDLIPEEYRNLQVWSLFGDPSLRIGGYN